MENKRYILGVDIGGTSVKIGVVNESSCIESTSIRNTFKGKPQELIPGIKSLCEYYINKFHIQRIGIGCPGEIQDGIVLHASNLGWRNFDILSAFNEAFPNKYIKVDNDGNTACLAEMHYGKLKGVDNGIFITLGKGIGGAIILDGKMVLGTNGLGGRFGHMVIRTNGRRCSCGRRGCFETYGSVTGLIQTVREHNSRWEIEEEKIDASKISGFMIVQAINENNKIVQESVQRWNHDLAEGILNLCAIFDSKMVIIAGGITESGLIDLEYIKEFIRVLGYDNCKISLATFKGKTGIIGAAALVD